MKRSILAGAWVSAALAAAVGMEVAQRYSRNANGVVVETAPVNATTTEIIEKPAAENGETPIAHALDSSTLDDTIKWVRAFEQSAGVPAPQAAVPERSRPVRPAPQIARVTDWHCAIVAPGAATYVQAGIMRSISSPFPCPINGEARSRWGSGSRLIRVSYDDGTTVELVEVWP